MEEIKSGNKYKYTEETERFKRMNRFLYSSDICFGMYIYIVSVVKAVL